MELRADRANGPKMVMKQGDRDWHGNTVLVNKQRTDVIALSPAQMVTADMVPDDPGIWLFHCHVADRMDAGMSALYQVLPANPN